MDIRNVQKTGNMHYVYLPTSWVKKKGLTSGSKVTVEVNNDGSITLFPLVRNKKQKHLSIKLDEVDNVTLKKLIVACYINPLTSFNIVLNEDVNPAELLRHKKLISGLEFVECEDNVISCSSSINIDNPNSMLKTIILKIKNLLIVKLKYENQELIQRYSEEIRRSHFLIDKNTIAVLSNSRSSDLKDIDLYFISQISHMLDRMSRHLVHLKPKNKDFFELVSMLMDNLKGLIENMYKKKDYFDYKPAMAFMKKVESIEETKVKELDTYSRKRAITYLKNISENVINWTVARNIENL
jgi:antitoxin component of MazEF toxin-antitoxin module